MSRAQNVRHRPRGFSLLELLIASIFLAILVVGGLLSLKSTAGFTTRTGRWAESSARALEVGEPTRNLVQPGQLPPPSDANQVTLMEVPATRQVSVLPNPCSQPGACPGAPSSPFTQMMNRVTVQVDWNEPRD